MPKYTLYFVQTVSTSVEVEAEDLWEAEGLAYDELPSLGYQRGIDNSGDWYMDNDYQVDGEWITP